MSIDRCSNCNGNLTKADIAICKYCNQTRLDEVYERARRFDQYKKITGKNHREATDYLIQMDKDGKDVTEIMNQAIKKPIE